MYEPEADERTIRNYITRLSRDR